MTEFTAAYKYKDFSSPPSSQKLVLKPRPNTPVPQAPLSPAEAEQTIPSFLASTVPDQTAAHPQCHHHLSRTGAQASFAPCIPSIPFHNLSVRAHMC